MIIDDQTILEEQGSVKALVNDDEASTTSSSPFQWTKPMSSSSIGTLPWLAYPPWLIDDEERNCFWSWILIKRNPEIVRQTLLLFIKVDVAEGPESIVEMIPYC